MLDTDELNALLNEGRTLQTELNSFMKTPTLLFSHYLVSRIDKLINDIKPQLLEPSNTEDDKLRLLITNLGRMAKNLKDIKTLIKVN